MNRKKLCEGFINKSSREIKVESFNNAGGCLATKYVKVSPHTAMSEIVASIEKEVEVMRQLFPKTTLKVFIVDSEDMDIKEELWSSEE